MTINLELPKLYNTPTNLPIRVLRGKKDGPIVFVSAAIHGDELNGIEIIRRLRKLNILNKLKGTLILVPIVNVYGIMNLSRYLPDRRDLNRSFPGSEKGSLASRVAKIFFDEKIKGKNAIIDFYASWCPPCKILANNLEDFEIIKPDGIEIFKVNIEDQLVLAKKYGVKKLPTLIYFKDGKPIKEYVGIQTSQELLDSSKKDFK